jgi:hypothetical protein
LKVMFEPEALPTTPLNVTCQEVPLGRPDSRKLTGTRPEKSAVAVVGAFMVTVTGLLVGVEQAETGWQVQSLKTYPLAGVAVMWTTVPEANHSPLGTETEPDPAGLTPVVSWYWV